MLKGSSTTWQEHEKYQLWLAYQVKTPLKILEPYFNRSISAINKYLARSGIRNSVKNSDFIPEIRVQKIKDLHLLIISAGLDEESVRLERRATRSWQPSPNTKSYLEKLGITGNPPWQPKNLEKKLPVKSGIGRSSQKELESYTDLQTCCHYLIRNGISVKKINMPNPLNWTYVVQDKPTTDVGLLRATNQIKIRNREPIYHIKGLTFE